MRLSIVVPARNEGKRIPKFLEEYFRYFSDAYGHNWEMLVVENGSSDDTLEVLKKYSRKFKQLKYVHYEGTSKGKGGAVHYGLGRVNGDIIGYVDADGSTPAFAFHDLVKRLESDKKVSGVIASRWRSDSVINRKQPVSRRVASRVFNLMVRAMFGMSFTDTQCGAKAFRKEAVKEVVGSLGMTNWAFDIDLLYRMKNGGFCVVEIPTTWNDREDSKLRVGKVSREMLLALVRYRLINSPFSFVVVFYDWFFGGGVKIDYRGVKDG